MRCQWRVVRFAQAQINQMLFEQDAYFGSAECGIRRLIEVIAGDKRLIGAQLHVDDQRSDD